MVKPTTGEHARKSDAKYTGVRKRKWGKWVSEIRLPNSRERIWLGSYDTPEKAARAFDAALFCLRGKNAKFNFPENPPEIAGGSSFSRIEIQSVAARFANEAAPPRKEGESLVSESPSISSVSEGGFLAESDLTIDWSFLDFFTTQTEDNGSNIEAFAGFDDFEFPGEFYPALPFLPPSVVDLGEENGGGVFSDQSSLWNF